MKELTREQELKVIRSLSSDDVINNGGGRVVFDLGADVAHYLELPNKDYVVKVALGDKGLNQNELEVEQYIKHHDEIALAEIPAVGHIVVLMEKVDTEITDLLYEYYNDDLYDDYDATDEIYDGYTENEIALMKALQYHYEMDKFEAEDSTNEISNVMDALTDLYGSTCDNAQIGRTADGQWVSFDYGFDPELGCGEQCSDTRDYIDTGDWCDLFLNTLMENINDYPDLWSCSPHGLMKQVEDEFFDYVNNEREEYDEPENIPETLSWEYSYTAADINSFCRTSKKYFINAEKSLDNSSYMI